METRIKKRLRSKYISQVEDFDDAVTLCEEYGIPDAGLESVDEYIERMKMHLDAERHGCYFKKVVEDMIAAGETDDMKREQLRAMFTSLENIISCDDDINGESSNRRFVEDFLSNDRTTNNILEDCERKIKQLGLKEATILVAGETNAGKSTFLNLMFGEYILATSGVSCTSAVTSIRYGERRVARVVYKDPERADTVMDLEQEGAIEAFHKYIFEHDSAKRERDHGIKEVKVFLPLDFLKCGLVLADTPGIGENEYLEQYLMDYVASTDILGFIYIIFTDNSGGIHEDRLLNLLGLIIKEQKAHNKAFPFDPKATLFVGNRIDAVPADSVDVVKRHVIKKLSHCWPEFDESMVVFFSTKRAKRDVEANADYINDNYKELLQSFSGLVYYAMERRLRVSYKWIEHVLQRIRHCLKTAVTRLAWTEKDNHERTKKHRDKLTMLKNNAANVIKNLRSEIKDRSEELFSEVKAYLSTDVCKLRLCASWREHEIPQVSADIEGPTHWMFIKQRVDAAFYDRVCTELEDWSDEMNNVASIEQGIIEHIQEELGILQDEIIKSEHDLKETRSSKGSVDSGASVRRLSLRRISIRPEIIEIPLKLPAKIGHRLGTIGRKRQSMMFTKNPIKWTQERSEKLLGRLLKNKREDGESMGALDTLIHQLMQRPWEILTTLEAKIPAMIEANIELLNSLEELRLAQHRNSTHYETMAFAVEKLKFSLNNYGEGCVFVNDFKSSEVRILEGQTSTGKSLTLTLRVQVNDMVRNDRTGFSVMKKKGFMPQGLWSYVSSGVLQKDNTQKPISIKLYMPSAGVENIFQEIAKLRYLVHEDVFLAEFLGIHHTDAETPTYIYDSHLQPLQTYIRCHGYNSSTDTPRILESIATGLGYLHNKRLVHMELTTDTVTVNEYGEVKMTGACMPRCAVLPRDIDVVAANFVYLSPEVLRHDLYTSTADVYGYGLLMYEILLQMKAYDHQRMMPLGEFIAKVEPESMLRLDHPPDHHLPGSVITLIKACVAKNESERANTQDIQESLAKISWDFNISSAVMTGADGTSSPALPHITWDANSVDSGFGV